MIHRSITLGARTQRQQRRQLNRIFLFWRSISPLDNRCPKSASLTSCAALPTYGLHDLRLLAANGTTLVEFPLFHSPATHGGIGMVLWAAAGRCVPFCRNRFPRFSLAFRRERTVLFSCGSFLLSLAVPPSRAADNTDGEHSGPP
jgi:hypothetical protein